MTVPHSLQIMFDKMPDNYLYAGLLSIVFPRATLIHVRRDPRDIPLSCWMTQFQSIRWANDIEHLIGRLDGHRRLTNHWARFCPHASMRCRMSGSLQTFRMRHGDLSTFAVSTGSPPVFSSTRRHGRVRTASVIQVRQPLYDRSVARWKNYQQSMKSLFDRLPASG